jgi:hypothetical protein
MIVHAVKQLDITSIKEYAAQHQSCQSLFIFWIIPWVWKVWATQKHGNEFIMAHFLMAFNSNVLENQIWQLGSLAQHEGYLILPILPKQQIPSGLAGWLPSSSSNTQGTCCFKNGSPIRPNTLAN